jgi:putative intracellular protease/amidase/YHS domain-containing protein
LYAQDSTAANAPPAALTGLDPVALVNGDERSGDPSMFVEHEGFRYLFSSDENRTAFQNDPARYQIQLNGNCGAMPEVAGNPDLFAVVRGKIYVFGSPSCRTSFTANPDLFLNRQPVERRNVAVFVHEGVELLDFAGPAEAFAAAGRHQAFNVYTVAVSTDEIVSQGFLTIRPEYSIDNCPSPDIIVLPGGNTGIPMRDDRVIQWIKNSANDAEVVMSVCTGAFLLAKAGLLDGLDATTHWGSIDALQEAAPKATVHKDRRVVDNGKIVTCAGVSAGIDGALHVVERLLGNDTAAHTARYMEYNWQPVAGAN